MNFTVHEKSGVATGFCLVKSCDKKINKNNEPYLDMLLGDASGEISAKYWRCPEGSEKKYCAGAVVKVQGLISEYNGADQMRIDKIREAIPSDEIDFDMLVPSADYSGEAMYNEIVGIAGGFKDKELASLVETLYDESREKLLFYPAAFKLHHAMRGGLLFHTLTIVRLAQKVCEVYPFVDRDLLLTGAMLHDIAKLHELEATESGAASGYSVSGTLVGHLVGGAIAVHDTAKKLGIAEEKAVLVEHMMISHHGVPEFGAAVRPLFIEAEILSSLDMLDARIFELASAVSDVMPGSFSSRQWALENRAFFNHGRADFSKKTNLEIY